MSSPTDEISDDDPRITMPRWSAWLTVTSSVTLIGLGIGLFARFSPGHINWIGLQWAASFAHIVIRDPTHTIRVGLTWDLAALLPGYVLGLALACYLGRRVFWTPFSHLLADVGLAASFAAGLFNGVQDGLLWTGVGEAQPNTWLFRAIEALSFTKFVALVVGGAVGACALATAAGRLLSHKRTRDRWEKALARHAGDETITAPALIEVSPAAWTRANRPFTVVEKLRSAAPPGGPQGSTTHWDVNYRVRGGTGGVGICASGGGIRSGSVTLGALQALRANNQLLGADHLVSVSGGGYMTGGFQLALTGVGGAASVPAIGGASPQDVFSAGSAEEDHLRRHSSYLADGPGQWVVALLVIFRAVASSFILIGLTITVAGVVIGRFYREVPVVREGLAPLQPLFLVPGAERVPLYPLPPWGVTLAVGAAGVVGLVAYLLLILRVWGPSPRGQRLRLVNKAVMTAAGLFVAVGVAVPAMLWASSAITRPLGLTKGTAAYSGALDLIFAYLSALGVLVWRNRQSISKGAASALGFVNKKVVNQVLPSSMVQMLLIWIVLTVAVVVSLLLVGWVATSGFDNSLWALVPVGALLLIVTFVDQTWLSLHPFYRRRLASAFAVRRVRHRGVDVASPYDFRERTPLSTYATPRPPFPVVTFLTTANITSQDRTPPGRRAVSYALRHDYVGGPEVGWIDTGFLEDLVSPYLRRDLTVEAAVAISGAAFASAMGSQTRFYEVFLAMTNIRLGAWLPNPSFLALKEKHLRNWTIPGLPRIRRLSYLFREIFGIHPIRSRMLLCTDGGHYDNLGLAELLRRRCEKIFCFDATGFSQPLASTLAGTLSLAREELGVEIGLNDPFSLVPGGQNALGSSPTLSALHDRLSQVSAITGKIAYPATDNQPAATGQLIFAQANLNPETPYHLLELRQEYPGFPWEGTADQWFNYSQFCGYHQLGRYLGERAAALDP